ncbi:MAG: discoidin domain-containing protein, partial [Propionibacteriaceae bacterium]|nr:discoidin domain-containing protein [Propionibacteriaceae bacterium]
NLTHENEGGFMLFCGCGGLSTDTVMRYNISLNDGAGADSHNEGPRVFFNAGQSDGEVYNNTFLLYPNVQLSKGGANGSTAVLFSNNVLLAQGDVRSTTEKAEPWRNNVFAGTWNSWPKNGEGNQVVPGLKMLDGEGLARLKVNTQSVIGAGLPIYPSVDEGLAISQDNEGKDIGTSPVPSHIRPDAGAWQLTPFNETADVAIADGGFENATQAAWTLTDATVATTGARNGSKSVTLNGGSVAQEFRAGLNKTYRLTAAVKGDVDVTLSLPRTENPVTATASQEGTVADGWTPVSTTFRTASMADMMTVKAAGTGSVDDIALTEIPDYVVDGSFESPSNSPWGGTRSVTDFVSGQYGANLGARANYENPEVVVPADGNYEMWAWGKTPSGSLAVGAKKSGGGGANIATGTIASTGWTQAKVDLNIQLDDPSGIKRFTAFCYSGGATVAGMFCDDVSVTPKWDGTATAVSASAVHTTPTAPADPPAPPKPVDEYIDFSEITVVGASSAQGDGPASNVNNANASAIWHSRWSAPAGPPPHWITLQGPANHELTELAYTPRQDSSWNGVANAWHIEGSSDAAFTTPVELARGTWAKDRNVKKVDFANPTSLRYIRLYIDTHYGDAPANQFGTAAIIRLKGYAVNPAASIRPDGGAQEATQGGGITVDVTGMRAGEATLTLVKGDVTAPFGTMDIDATGKGSKEFTIPADAATGEWTLRISQPGNEATGLAALTAEKAFTVKAAGTDPTVAPTATPQAPTPRAPPPTLS